MQTRNTSLKYILMLFSILILLIVILPAISAYSFGGGWGYANSPLDYLNNQWVMFMIYFMFFFAIIYYTTNKSFKNPPVAAVVGLALSLFIAIAMAQRGWLDSYMGSEIGAWALLISALIAVGFTVKFSFETFGRIGSVAAILILWFILFSTPPETILPPELLTDTFLNVYYFVSSWIGLIILLIISAVIITARGNRKWGYANNTLDSLFGSK